jgi:hypothetical protein
MVSPRCALLVLVGGFVPDGRGPLAPVVVSLHCGVPGCATDTGEADSGPRYLTVTLVVVARGVSSVTARRV